MYMYLQIDVALYDRGLVGKPFSYLVPATQAHLCGSSIIVPMGNHLHRAVVLRVGKYTEEHELTIIENPEVMVSGLLSLIQCDLILYMAATYLSPIHKVLRLFVPEKIWNGTFEAKRHVSVQLAAPDLYTLNSRMKAMLAMEEYMKEKADVSKKELVRHFSPASYKKAVSLGMLLETSGCMETTSEDTPPSPLRNMTVEQQHVYDEILKHPEKSYLLHGVTGAGKTEIYLHLAAYYALQDKQTLLIVPEIVLTPQLRLYFSKIFGSKISIFHSKLSEGERLQEWCRVKEGETIIVLGSRSAFFAPFQNLGLVVIDEEHEWTYKNEQNPRYYIHTIAYYIHGTMNEQGIHNTLLLGSATPRVETYARTFAKKNSLHLLTLDKKIFEQTAKSLEK